MKIHRCCGRRSGETGRIFSQLAGPAVSICLKADGNTTEVLHIQDGNDSDKARRESERNWKAMLAGLKKVAESG